MRAEDRRHRQRGYRASLHRNDLRTRPLRRALPFSGRPLPHRGVVGRSCVGGVVDGVTDTLRTARSQRCKSGPVV